MALRLTARRLLSQDSLLHRSVALPSLLQLQPVASTSSLTRSFSSATNAGTCGRCKSPDHHDTSRSRSNRGITRSFHSSSNNRQAGGLPPRGSGGGSPGQPIGNIFGQGQKKPGETLAEVGVDLTQLAAEGKVSY